MDFNGMSTCVGLFRIILIKFTFLVPHFVGVHAIVCFVWNSPICSGMLLVFIFGPPQFMFVYLEKANEVKMCETTRTKTYKTKQYKQIQIYISTIHAMKHFKALVF